MSCQGGGIVSSFSSELFIEMCFQLSSWRMAGYCDAKESSSNSSTAAADEASITDPEAESENTRKETNILRHQGDTAKISAEAGVTGTEEERDAESDEYEESRENI